MTSTIKPPSNSKELDSNRLQQHKALKWFRRHLSLTELIPVCFSDSDDNHLYGLHCALVPLGMEEEVLSELSWDLGHTDGKPGASISYKKGEERVDYHRFGDRKGFEPLLIDRHFHGMRPDYFEINEEFRLFHDLYYDRKTDQYFKIDDDGNEELVVIIKENGVDIRLKEILQFLAIKEMYLSIQFDYREMAPFKLEELGLSNGGNETRDDLMIWGLHFGDLGFGKKRAFSRLWGKRLVKPLPKHKSGFWGFAEEEVDKYVDFIIDVDAEGNDVSHTSDPDQLANYFGANANAPHYLTPVHFRKQVLDKYYNQPTKFKVEDCYLRCGSLWGLQMDNQHDNQICAWLGDLGRDLPYSEQLHWRSHNVAPQGSISETYFRRQLLGQFTKSTRLEDHFKANYRDLQEVSERTLGWPLVKPLRDEDMHHLTSLRVPAGNEQRDFDDQILGLTKTMIDSINERGIGKLIAPEEKSDLRGISLLEKVFSTRGVADYEPCISFLRKLQELRSSSAAHRKSKSYPKVAAKFGVEAGSLSAAFAAILQEATDVLGYLAEVVRSGQLDPLTKP